MQAHLFHARDISCTFAALSRVHCFDDAESESAAVERPAAERAASALLSLRRMRERERPLISGVLDRLPEQASSISLAQLSRLLYQMTMLQLHADEPSYAAFAALFAQFAPRYESLCRAVADGSQPFVAARDALRSVERAQRGVVDSSGHRDGGFSGGFGGGGDGGGGGGVSILNDAIASQLHMVGLSLRLERPEWALELPSSAPTWSTHGGEARDDAVIAMPSMQESVDFGWRAQVRAH